MGLVRFWLHENSWLCIRLQDVDDAIATAKMGEIYDVWSEQREIRTTKRDFILRDLIDARRYD